MIFVNTSAPVKASERSFGSDLSVCLSVLTFTYVTLFSNENIKANTVTFIQALCF